jgi:hypothetical protein
MIYRISVLGKLKVWFFVQSASNATAKNRGLYKNPNINLRI